MFSFLLNKNNIFITGYWLPELNKIRDDIVMVDFVTFDVSIPIASCIYCCDLGVQLCR
jgi:hypothetical protein